MQRKYKNNPSVSSADSSLYTREPFLASALPSTSHSSLENENLGGTGLEESSAREEDLGGSHLPRGGRSLGPPARPSPAQAPDFRILYCKYSTPEGPRREISFGGS